MRKPIRRMKRLRGIAIRIAEGKKDTDRNFLYLAKHITKLGDSIAARIMRVK